MAAAAQATAVSVSSYDILVFFAFHDNGIVKRRRKDGAVVDRGGECDFLRNLRIFNAIEKSSEIEGIVVSSDEFRSDAFAGFAYARKNNRSPADFPDALRYIEIPVFPFPSSVRAAITASA